MKKKISVGSILVYLFLSIWAFTTIYPIIWVIQNSFKAKDKILADSFSLPVGDLFTTANYRKAFGNLNIFGAYRNSIFISMMVSLLVILLAGMAAYALARYCFRGSSFLYSMVVSAMMFPVFATIIPVFSMETSWGIVNTSSWGLTMLSVILPQVAGNLAFSIVVLSGYMKSLPLELEEAAYIDGCNRWQTYWKIVFPLLKPTIATVAIIDAMAFWNDYLLPSLVLARKELYTLPIATQAFYGTYSTDLGLVMAALLLAMLPILVLYLFLQRYIVEGVTSGAVKG